VINGAAHDLKQLRRKLLTLSALVEENAGRAVLALRGKDREAAGVVMHNDGEINTLEISIEEDCVALLADGTRDITQVRMIVAALRINTDLERIGDLASNIARHVEELSRHEQALIPGELLLMADCALAMLRKALDALVDLDAAGSLEVCSLDDEVDNLNRVIYGIVRDRIAANPAMTDKLLSVLGAARHLERIADCATNIAEDVVFMTSGSIIRHHTDKTS
jgi:phosphate transport system protein